MKVLLLFNNKMNELLRRLMVFHIVCLCITIGLSCISISWEDLDDALLSLWVASVLAWLLYCFFLILVICNSGIRGTQYLHPVSYITCLRRVLLCDIVRIIFCKLFQAGVILSGVALFIRQEVPGMRDLVVDFPLPNTAIPLILLVLSILQQCLTYSALQRIIKLYVCVCLTVGALPQRASTLQSSNPP